MELIKLSTDMFCGLADALQQTITGELREEVTKVEQNATHGFNALFGFIHRNQYASEHS